MELQELIDILKSQINSKKYKGIFSFVSLFGSLNIKRDLDLFALPSQSIKKGKFLKLFTLFLKDLKKELKNKKIELLVVTHSTFEEEVNYIAKLKGKKRIIIHMCSYNDLHPIPIPGIVPILKKPEVILAGNISAINKVKRTKLDYFYNYLFMTNCLLSNYPPTLKKDKIFQKVKYVYKHALGIKKKLVGSPEKVFFDCCEALDKKS